MYQAEIITKVKEEKNIVNIGLGILRWLNNNFEKIFLTTGIVAMILIMSYQTFFRYWLHNILPASFSSVWSEELSRIIFVWITYLALSESLKKRELVRVDVIYNALPERLKKLNWIVIDIFVMFLAGVVAYQGYILVSKLIAYPQYTSALRWQYYAVYSIIPLGFGMTFLRATQDIIKQIKECGIRDTLIGIAITLLLFLPLLLNVKMSATAWLFSYFIILVILSVPIAISLGLAAIITIFAANTIPLNYSAQLSFNTVDNSVIMCIPFFVAAGFFMGVGGLSEKLLNLCDGMLGRLYGGMGLATIATCMIFAAMSGSGPATVAAIGSITIPAMIQRGYDKYFAGMIVACAGAIGVMIPPSNPFVVYGVSSNTSIGKLFLAGVVPGLLAGIVLMFVTYQHAKKHNWRSEKGKGSAKEILKLTWDAKWALMVPVIILGGIYSGMFTPTEAAAVAALYGLIVGMFVYKEINKSNIVYCLVESCKTSAIVIVLIAMATLFGNIMTMEQVPTRVAEFIMSITDNKYVFLFMITILLLFVGTFMEALAAIVILTPILLPVAKMVGIDPIHFGCIMVVNLAVGFVTPPVGVNLFVASGIAQLDILRMVKIGVKLLLGMLFVLLLVTYIPQISLFLPGLMK